LNHEPVPTIFQAAANAPRLTTAKILRGTDERPARQPAGREGRRLHGQRRQHLKLEGDRLDDRPRSSW